MFPFFQAYAMPPPEYMLSDNIPTKIGMCSAKTSKAFSDTLPDIIRNIS